MAFLCGYVPPFGLEADWYLVRCSIIRAMKWFKATID